VLDFGLTRAASSTPGAALTTPGTQMGTPGYMPPEQVYGLPTDQRTDLYALGCVGYWLLAGQKPFESDNAGELLRQHAQATPPPLSSRARQAVPAPLEAVVMACLSKDPDRRPQSADQLCEALDAAADGNAWSAGEADRWWEEHWKVPEGGVDSTLGP